MTSVIVASLLALVWVVVIAGAITILGGGADLGDEIVSNASRTRETPDGRHRGGL